MLVESIKAQLSNLTAMYSDKCLIIQLKKKKQQTNEQFWILSVLATCELH